MFVCLYILCSYTESRIRELVSTAFAAPLENPTAMIRLTFIVGGGKLVRSKYNDDMPKWMMNALRENGYVDDKSAAETFDSQGTYKYQHDTGANLKYVIVYPHVACSKNASASDTSANNNGGTSALPMAENSHEYIIMTASLATLEEITRSKICSWKQKKNCLKVLQQQHEQFLEIESKLMTGKPLDAIEQFYYDNNCGNDDEKISWMQSSIKAMVANGQLTALEKEELLEKMKSNANSNNQSKVATVESIHPITYMLRYHEDIVKLRVKVLLIMDMEAKSRNVPLTIADLKIIEEKPDLLQEIQRYELASKGWFIDDKEFQVQCEYAVAEANKKFQKRLSSSKPKSKSVPKTSNSGSGWSTVGTSNKPKTATAKPTPVSSGFAAAFNIDSDSD